MSKIIVLHRGTINKCPSIVNLMHSKPCTWNLSAALLQFRYHKWPHRLHWFGLGEGGTHELASILGCLPGSFIFYQSVGRCTQPAVYWNVLLDFNSKVRNVNAAKWVLFWKESQLSVWFSIFFYIYIVYILTVQVLIDQINWQTRKKNRL